MFAPFHHVNICDVLLYTIKNLNTIAHHNMLTCGLYKVVKVLVYFSEF
jgi:hypothetical protein